MHRIGGFRSLKNKYICDGQAGFHWIYLNPKIGKNVGEILWLLVYCREKTNILRSFRK
jgi:hypothetical protein